MNDDKNPTHLLLAMLRMEFFIFESMVAMIEQARTTLRRKQVTQNRMDDLFQLLSIRNSDVLKSYRKSLSHLI